MSTLRAILLATIAALFALSSTACTATSCTRDADSSSVPFNDTNDPNGSMVDGNTYYSAPVGGPYAYFPPFRTITFEHRFDTLFYSLQFWLAFSSKGTLAPSAGNMTELRVPDDGGPPPIAKDSVSVYNNTCSDFYLWVVAQKSVGGDATPGGVAANSGDAGAP